MTRKRFFKLRRALLTELYIQAKNEKLVDEKTLRKAALTINKQLRPDLNKCNGSYDGAWDKLRPIRYTTNFHTENIYK